MPFFRFVESNSLYPTDNKKIIVKLRELNCWFLHESLRYVSPKLLGLSIFYDFCSFEHTFSEKQSDKFLGNHQNLINLSKNKN